jgi:protein-tyrosine-phosphatase
MSTILFLCTGNYYRSRFAEHLFNHRAQAIGLPWRATSRGLAIELGIFNVGPISADTVGRMAQLNVTSPASHRAPIGCCDDDLSTATRVIAVKEAEHRPLLSIRFPGWEDRVEYWHVHDLDAAGADVALAEIERHVQELIAEIIAGEENEVDDRE